MRLFATMLARSRPVPTDPARTGSASIKPDISSLPVLPPAGIEWRSPREHAIELLTWLRSPGGRIGEITSVELQAIYREFLATKGWVEASWIAVARDLRRILGVKKQRAYRDGREIVVFRIPAAPSVAELVEAGRRAAA